MPIPLSYLQIQFRNSGTFLRARELDLVKNQISRIEAVW